jgi:hypothetical protein
MTPEENATNDEDAIRLARKTARRNLHIFLIWFGCLMAVLALIGVTDWARSIGGIVWAFYMLVHVSAGIVAVLGAVIFIGVFLLGPFFDIGYSVSKIASDSKARKKRSHISGRTHLFRKRK